MAFWIWLWDQTLLVIPYFVGNEHPLASVKLVFAELMVPDMAQAKSASRKVNAQPKTNAISATPATC